MFLPQIFVFNSDDRTRSNTKKITKFSTNQSNPRSTNSTFTSCLTNHNGGDEALHLTDDLLPGCVDRQRPPLQLQGLVLLAGGAGGGSSCSIIN